jgi:hypothetical protein
MTHRLMLAAMFALLSSAPALAQESPNTFDSRWTPYLGCWTIVQDQYGLSAPVPAGTTVCVRPSGRSGVAVTTTVDGKNVLEQTIVADGSSQALSHQNCTGTAINDWSRDGQRLFTRVELDCANQPKRSISGISLLTKGEWVEAQATIVDGNSDVRLRRYRRTSDQAASAPAAATAPLSIEDVIEASAKVQSEALEAALDQVNPRFSMNSRVLTQLADNGVSRNVIDLMVAQAYPDKFQVERDIHASRQTASYGGAASVGSSSVYMGSSVYSYPMYDPFYSSYYYYSPFAYPYYWGPYYSYRMGSPFYPNYYNYNYYGFPGSGGYYGGGSSGDVPPRPGSPDSAGGDGVVVNGRGYTRVRPAGSSNSGGAESATPTSRSPNSTRGVRSAGSRSSGDSGSTPNTGSSSSSSSSSSSGSSGSSGTSSGGYSSGSSGGSSGGGGRTAQPR